LLLINFRIIQAVLCDNDIKKGMVEIIIVEMFLDTSLNLDSKVVLTVDIQGQYLAIRKFKSGH
jgi:diacylglycerol kinase family enzyme